VQRERRILSNIPATHDALAVAQRRLENRWCTYPGPWKEFIADIEKTGTAQEKMVVQRFPAQFKVDAFERAQRIQTLQENRLMEYLERMDHLTQATKTDRNGDSVPDNGVRFNALKFLLERALGAVHASEKPDTQTGGALNDLFERREELRAILKAREGKVVDVEVEPSE